MANYAHPETLVSTNWVAEHASDPNVRVVEVDVDTKAYDEGHIPGALGWAWNSQLCDTVRRDILPKSQLEDLMAASGISNDTTVVIYGDNNNWFAAWALWQLKIYGHKDVRLMNGGRKKWLSEGRELSTETRSQPDPRWTVTAPVRFPAAVRAALVRQLGTGRRGNPRVHPQTPPGLPETCQRGGHIPGARNIPWGKACNEDGTFKSADELRTLYGSEGIDGEKPVIAYCRIGERSSHTWFVLKYLLGLENVVNYDGSWTEWGNLVGAAVEKGAAATAKA
jgi:thiosulfate/3-mercaptopyruvate sulfurtransferase